MLVGIFVFCVQELFSNIIYEISWRIFRAGQDTDGNMGHAHCILDT